MGDHVGMEKSLDCLEVAPAERLVALPGADRVGMLCNLLRHDLHLLSGWDRRRLPLWLLIVNRPQYACRSGT